MQIREKNDVIKDIKESIDHIKDELSVLENKVEFFTKKNGGTFKTLARNYSNNIEVSYGWIDRTSIDKIEVKGVGKATGKFVTVRIYNMSKEGNLTTKEEVELIKKLINKEKTRLKKRLESYKATIITLEKRLNTIDKLVREFNTEVKELATKEDSYIIEQYIRYNINLEK